MGDQGAAPKQATDAELIARWQKGDERAAATLVERHAQPLARFAASLGERDGIEELVQDTFVRAFNSEAGYHRLRGRERTLGVRHLL